MNTSMTTKIPFSATLSTAGYQRMLTNTLKDPKRVSRFVASLTSAVATTPALQDCDPSTIVSAALTGESLGLSPSPQMGEYYLVPYSDRKTNVKSAQFQLGYRGYIRLALKSGAYRRLNAFSVKEGELVSWNPVTEDLQLNVDTTDGRESLPTIGYAAAFELLNGFQKTLYWSREKMLYHANRYSQAFSVEASVLKTRYGEKQKVSFADYEAGNYPKADEWMYSSFWYKDFDAMATKTMLRQLLSKWGILSADMVTAFEQDTAEPAAVEEPILAPVTQQENTPQPVPFAEQQTQQEPMAEQQIDLTNLGEEAHANETF